MSMNNSQRYDAGRQYQRANDVKVSSRFTDSMEKLAMGHYAMGNISEFQVGMTAMSKVSPEARIEKMEKTLRTVVNVLGKGIVEEDDEGG